MDLIISIIIITILTLSICYIVKSKKKGIKCIGCESNCNQKQRNTNIICNCGTCTLDCKDNIK